MLGDRRSPNAASTTTQHEQPSTAPAGDEELVQDTMADAAPSTKQKSEHQEGCTGLLSGECNQIVISQLGDSTGQTQRIPNPPSCGGIDGDSEYDGGDEDEDSEDGEGIKENNEKIALNGNSGIKKPEDDPRMDGLTAKVRRELTRYLKQDRIHTQMVMDGRFSLAEVMSATAKNQDGLLSGLKRARWVISEDDAIEELQHQRIKRTKREGDAAGASSQPLPVSHGRHTHERQRPPPYCPPSSKREYNRQGALGSTSRYRATRSVGSAVQKLHKDRLRRPARKFKGNKNHEFLCYPPPDIVIYANYYNEIGGPQPRPSSHPQRRPGSERTSSTLNSAVEDVPGNSLNDIPNGAPEENGSNGSGDLSMSSEKARDEAHTAPRRQYRQPNARPVQDEPFFSDGLFNGMLNGQPDNNHVGSMYTRSHEQEIDQHYQRVTGPRPGIELESDTLEGLAPPSPHQQMTYNISGSSRQGDNAPPTAHGPTGAPRPAQVPNVGFDVGDIADWHPAWSSFVNDHDNKPLLRGHFPDEYSYGSHSRTVGAEEEL